MTVACHRPTDDRPTGPGEEPTEGSPVERDVEPAVEPAGAASPGSPFAVLRGPLIDVGLPLVAYYGLRLAGVSEWTALLAATAAAAVRLTAVAVLRRQVTWFSAVMLAVFGIGLVTAFLSGDERFLLVKESFGTAAVGIVFLASLAGRRPLTFSAAVTSQPHKAEMFDRAYRDEVDVRRMFRVSAVVWGIGLLLEAIVRVPLVYLLPVDVMAGVSTAMSIVVIASIATWNGAWGARLHRRGRAEQADPTGGTEPPDA